MKFKKCLILTAITSALFACNGGGGANNSSNNPGSGGPTPVNVLVSPLTIDNTGVVPAFTDSVTSVKVYLHNNTNDIIKDIQYSWVVNLPDDKDNTKEAFLKLNSLSASSLTTIAAKGALAIPVNIPALKATLGKGSALLKVSYTYNGKPQSFSHVVDFRLAQNSDKSGVYISSDSISSSFGNSSSGFTTLYAYGGGNSGSTYDITAVNLDPVLGHIVQGDLKGTTIASHQVATIELNTAMVSKDSVGSLTINSRLAQGSSQKSQMSRSFAQADSFSSTKSVSVLASTQGSDNPIVLSSLIPFIDTASTTNGKVFFYNAGTGTATLSNVSGTSGISNVSADSDCSSGFGPGQSCMVNFNLTKSSSGSGAITGTDVNSTSISAPVTWYNSNSSVAQLGLSSDADTNLFLLHGTNPYTGKFDVTVTNLSSSTVANISMKTPIVKGGSAVPQIESTSITKCDGSSLTVANPSCTYAISVSDTVAPDSGIINLSATGTANNTTITALDAVSYKVYRSTAQLALDFSSPSVTIYGDNAESATVTLKITNLGTDSSADLDSLIVEKDYKSISGNVSYDATTSCNGKVLKHGESCEETINLKSQSYQTGTPLQASFNYIVKADGIDPATAQTPLEFTVQPYDSAIALTSITQSGNSEGDGKESTTLVKFLAGQDSDKKVTLTYKNLSQTESMTISGVQFAAGLPTGLIPEYADTDSTSCYSDNGHSIGKVLAPGASCTVTLDNQLYLLGDSNNITNLDFGFPNLIITSDGSNQYSFVPQNKLGYTDNKYYAKNYQAVITDTDAIESNGSESAVLRVTHTATGVTAGGYSGGIIAEKTQITPQYYLSLPATPDSHCTISKQSGAVMENCNLADGYTVSNDYKVNYQTESSVGVDPVLGGTMTINFIDLLTGKAWAYNNNTAILTGASVNGGGDQVSILPKPSKYIFGAYSQWLYQPKDNTLYVFKNNQANGSIFDSNKAYIESASSTLFSGGINAIASFKDKVFVATGSNTNRITSCNLSSATGAIDTASCQALSPASSKASANLTDLAIFKGNLYALDNKGGVTMCNLTDAGDILTSSCHLTATDAPSVTIGSGRQQKLMNWSGMMIYTIPEASRTGYIACTQEDSGELDNCKELFLDANNSSPISTSVLLSAGSKNAYLYTMSKNSNYLNNAYGCTLTKSGNTISTSNCIGNPLFPNPPEASAMIWGGYNGGNTVNYDGDSYVMYYDNVTQHLIGTITTSEPSDGDTFGYGNTRNIGEEFYLVSGSDNTINQPSYLKLLVRNQRYYISSSSAKYNQNLFNIVGNIKGKYNGRIVLDTFSIH